MCDCGKGCCTTAAQVTAMTLREVAMAIGRSEIVYYGFRGGTFNPMRSRVALSEYLKARADELDPPDTTGGPDVTITTGA